MRLAGNKVDGILVVTVAEKRIDAVVVPDFKSRLGSWIEEGNRKIVLDLFEVDFIDSSGLGAIVSVLKALENNGDLVICRVKEPVMGLFRLIRMNRVFQFFTTVEEATNAFL